MKTLVASEAAVTLVASETGCVRFQPPRALCGELEVFAAGEAVAWIDGRAAVEAPAFGFVARTLVPDGSFVPIGTPLVLYRSA